jgi:hypothetical protein
MTTERSSYSDPGGERLEEAASGVADRVAETAQQTVGTHVDTGMTKASDMLEQIAGAVRTSGEQLRTEQPQVASFADTAAGQVERLARYLHDSSAQDLVREAEDFARRQPAIFLGGALALGLAASRFLKASPATGSSRSGYQGYGSRYGGARSMGGNGAYPSDYAGAMGYARGRDARTTGYSSTGTSSTPGYASGAGYAGSMAQQTTPAGTPVMTGSSTRTSGSSATGGGAKGAPDGSA